MSARIWCSVGMMLAALFLPFWVFALLAFFYACVWTPYELLAIAVLIDAQFGNPELGSAYIYTLVVSMFFVAGTYIKPLLRFYT